MLGWIKRRRANELRLRAARLKQRVQPFHYVLSTLRAEGTKKEYLAALLLKEIQARENEIARIEARCK